MTLKNKTNRSVKCDINGLQTGRNKIKHTTKSVKCDIKKQNRSRYGKKSQDGHLQNCSTSVPTSCYSLATEFGEKKLLDFTSLGKYNHTLYALEDDNFPQKN